MVLTMQILNYNSNEVQMQIGLQRPEFKQALLDEMQRLIKLHGGK